MLAMPPRFHFLSSGAVAILFLLCALAPILIVAGRRGRLTRPQVNFGFALSAVILSLILPELFRLGRHPHAIGYWAMWCSFLFVQSLILSLFAMREIDPNTIDYGPVSRPDDEGHS